MQKCGSKQDPSMSVKSQQNRTIAIQSMALDASNVLDASNLLNAPSILDVSDVLDASDVFRMMDVLDINDVTDVPNVMNISDNSYDLSSTSDIPQVTTTEEVLKVYHHADMEYYANDPLVLSSSPPPFSSRPPTKPPYFKQCGNINLHDMSTNEFLQPHVHELGQETTSDDVITDDPPVDEA
jgi:hypothetical protein